MLSRFDLIVSMEPRHIRALANLDEESSVKQLLLGDLDPQTPDRRAIADPWGKDEGVFHSSFERIDRCVSRLAELLRATPTETA